MFKNKKIRYVGEYWRDFKTQLTNDYIKNSNDNSQPPYVKYSLLDKKVEEDFVKSHTTPDFLANSQRGKENRVRNIYPDRLSRGGMISQNKK